MLLLVVTALVAVSVSLSPINYALYSLFLTPTFVLLAELSSGDRSLPWVRIVNTLVGGALSLAGIRLLRPSPEQRRFPDLAAAALFANREHFRQVVDGLLGRNPDGIHLGEARRKMGLSTLEAEDSFQRLLSESWRTPEVIEPLMALLVYTRRFASSVISLSTARREDVQPRAALLEHWAASVDEVLGELLGAVAAERPPRPMPDLMELLTRAEESTPGPAGLPDTLLLRQLERVTRQLQMLHGAAAREARTGPLPQAV
jgi:uncharacterized membrane protein YccC